MNIITILFFLYLSSFVNSYDKLQLNIGVWLSGAAYCEKDAYSTMILNGPASGFTYKQTIYDPRTDLQGYIGVLNTTKSIYVVLRGSSSIMNWLDDFEVKLVPYDSYPECECKVHYGFYRSALGVSSYVVDSVKMLKTKYLGYDVVVTGHSYAASTGQLLAMELVKSGINVKLYNYGQPRVGDPKYASFVNSKLDEYFRTTHNRDIVPHVPPIEGFGYLHSCREIFENETGELVLCSDNVCEDKKCSDQFKLTQTSTDDHLYYLGHRVSCEDSVV